MFYEKYIFTLWAILAFWVNICHHQHYCIILVIRLYSLWRNLLPINFNTFFDNVYCIAQPFYSWILYVWSMLLTWSCFAQTGWVKQDWTLLDSISHCNSTLCRVGRAITMYSFRSLWFEDLLMLGTARYIDKGGGLSSDMVMKIVWFLMMIMKENWILNISGSICLYNGYDTSFWSWSQD